MADREYGHFKGEGGRVWKLSLPLSDVLADQLAKGQLVEVEPEKPKRAPAKKAGDKTPPVEPLTDDEKKAASERDIEVEGKDPAEVRAQLAKSPDEGGK